MRRIHEIPWLRIGAESAAIVVSILLAFAIQVWSEGQLDRRTVRYDNERTNELLDDARLTEAP